MGDASRPLGVDDDLMELLWCNGHVVMQSQTHRKLPPRPEKAAAAAAAAVMQEDEAGLWFPFSHADSLDKDIFSDLFCEAVPQAVGIKPDCYGDGNGSKSSDAPSELMPPPKSTMADGGELSDLVQARSTGKAAAAAMEQEGASASSFCGSSNQVQVQHAGRVQSAGTAAYGSSARLQSAVGSGINANGRGREATVASSSGRSNGCFTNTTTTSTEPTSASLRSSSKRKRLDSRTEDYSESPSEDAESESLALIERKPPLKLPTARRSRAAEVHNLSERRRRDRINEKMKALQELIPHCNKTDKASMLDEAIEYLKTLQMQVQMMWMGSGMAPPAVMFPGMHQYLPRRMPSFMAPPPAAAAAAQSLPDHYAHFLGVNHHLQPPSHHHQHYAAQGMGYYSLGAKAVQQSPALPIHHVHSTANGATLAPAAAAAATNSNTPGNGMHPNRI